MHIAHIVLSSISFNILSRHILLLIFSVVIINLLQKMHFCHCIHNHKYRHAASHRTVDHKTNLDSHRRFVTIFNPGIPGFISSRSHNKIPIINSRDYTSDSVVWEYIPAINGTINLRHKSTNRYLCFNKRGRPTLRKKIKQSRCNLSIQKNLSTVNIVLKSHSWYVAFCQNRYPLTYRKELSKCNSSKPVFFSFIFCQSLPPSCLSICKGFPSKSTSTCSTSCRNLLFCSLNKSSKYFLYSMRTQRILALIKKIRQR
nr:fibroblast growth factor [Dugesia japonica]